MFRPVCVLAALALLPVAAFVACKGGGGDPPSDAGPTADAATFPPIAILEAGTGSSGSDGGSLEDASGPAIEDCVVQPVANPNAGTSGGPPGCKQPSDCTYRYTGPYCCPNEPQALTNGVGSLFDEARNGAFLECGEPCKTVRCTPQPQVSATCVAGSCVLVR